MFAVTMRHADQTRRYSISRQRAGWEVTLERDDAAPRHVFYQDWHRVERALALFRLEVADLSERGWREVQP